MGYYIEGLQPRYKARQLAKMHGATEIPEPERFGAVPKDKALIMVVENGRFEAALFVWDAMEFGRIKTAASDHSRRSLLMDLKEARKLSESAREGVVEFFGNRWYSAPTRAQKKRIG